MNINAMRKCERYIWRGILGFVCAGNLYAVDFGRQVPTEKQVIDALSPKTSVETDSIYLKGLRKKEDSDVTGKAQAKQAAKLSMQVLFAVDSSNLTSEAKQQLRPIGNALNSGELKTFNFAVVGHTDARGTDDYNMALSQQRAMAVKGYLTANFGIDTKRLQTHGKGKQELKNPAHPLAAENRRVEVVNLGGN